MIEIITGILIGITTETFGISMYILYKRRQNKPNIQYNNSANLDENIDYNEVLNPPNVIKAAVDYNEL